MTATDKTKKGIVYSYARWSSELQSAGDSEKRQQQQAIDWCRRHGMTATSVPTATIKGPGLGHG
jgi:DNA invertase Pin-like site-specific DNA recombinase